MKQLLLIHPRPAEAVELTRTLSVRQDTLSYRVVESVDSARRELKEKKWEAVLLAPGLKQLSRLSFLQFARGLTRPPKLMQLGGEPEEGVTTLHPGTPEHVVDQLLSILGLARSASFDCRVIEELGFAGAVEFAKVEWPGAREPLLRAQVRRGEFDPESFGAAQRAGQLRGPGLAQTLEVFWDDPRPHLLQVLPRGVSLQRLLRQRPLWGVEVALSIARGAADGIATLHAADFSAGTLRAPSIWLTDAGQVLLLGHGLTQLPYTRQTYYGLPSEAPPEEYGTQLPPKIPGDPFRLGILLMQLAVNDSPVRQLSPLVYLQRDWEPDFEAHYDTFGPRVVRLLELLFRPDSTDRPRGDLLRQVLDEVVPKNRSQLISEAVTWSRAAPDSSW
ncbi:MAG: hypothetical protein Q8N23_08265 [Archangium sp.]|nr:hypothetical protein [Archangium sp.]MDP3152648.1 hypothetical protein [Archangium sp.]MDP3575134.1 hypothetical protein [Archangium sp.]